MRGYVTGWRQQVKKEVEKQVGSATPPAPVAEAPPATPPAPQPAVIAEPEPVPIVRPKRQPRREAQHEVIDVPAKSAGKPLTLPSVRVPRMPLEWLLFAGFLLVFKISTDATYVTAEEIFGVGMVSWWTCALVQGIISAIERFFFAGSKNWFTWAVLVGDGLINAVGLVVEQLPGFFTSSLWNFLVAGTDLAEYIYDPTSWGGKALALLVGMFLAWAGDAMLDLAMKRR